MVRLSYVVYRRLASLRRRLRRRLTPAGWLVLLGLGLAGAVGADLDQSDASVTFSILGCLLTIATVWSGSFHLRYRADSFLPRYASVGQPFVARIKLRNQTQRPWQGLELLHDLGEPLPSFEEFKQLYHNRSSGHSFRLSEPSRRRISPAQLKIAPVALLPPRGEAEVLTEMTPMRRGVLRLTGVTLARPDPLGLFRACVRQPLTNSVLVLPRRYQLPSITLPGQQRHQQGGVPLASSVGESEEFVSLREYRPGDALRRVHWRSSARTGRLVVKEYQDEYFVRHALVLDTFGGAEHLDAFEEAVSVAASFACTVNTQESLLDLMFVGSQAVCLTTGRGVGHVEQALQLLASVQLCQRRSFAELHELVLRHASLVSGCICILLDWDAARRQLLSELSARGIESLVLFVAGGDHWRRLHELPAGELPPDSHLLHVGSIQADLLAMEV